METKTDTGWVTGDTEEVACNLPPIVIQPGATWSDSIGFGGCYQRSNCMPLWMVDSTSATMRIFLRLYDVDQKKRLSKNPVVEVISNPFLVRLVAPL